MMVAALYVEAGGVYFGLPDVDPWDQVRDARKYQGPHPVVAHPPCQLWTNMTGVNWKRYGGAHNRPANDGGCFARALDAVRTWGGVLEHPAGSYAWNTFALPRPSRGGWISELVGGVELWTTEVAQSAYGHPARKLTWLAYCGTNPPPALHWYAPKGTHQIGWFDRKRPTLGKRAASATPIPFRDLLINMAKECKRA